MNKTKWMTGSLMALALLAGDASAQAQPRQAYPQDQGDLPDEAQPPADEAAVPEDQANPSRADDDFSDVVAADQDRAGSPSQTERHGRQDDRSDATPADQAGEEAITSCALAARDEAERDGGYAEVRQVQEPRETDDGYDVEGDVVIRSGWRAQDGTSRHFSCSVQNGRIMDVTFRDRAIR